MVPLPTYHEEQGINSQCFPSKYKAPDGRIAKGYVVRCMTPPYFLVHLLHHKLPGISGLHGGAPDHVDQDDVLVVLHLHGAGHQEQDPQRARPPGPLRPRRPQGARHAHVHHGAGHGLQRAQALPAVVVQLPAHADCCQHGRRNKWIVRPRTYVDRKNLGTEHTNTFLAGSELRTVSSL